MEDILISLLPIIIIVAVWIYIMFFVFRKNSKNNLYHKKQDEMISLLTEIKEEIKQINQNSNSK
jgi:preprotein translocase subunit YajC